MGQIASKLKIGILGGGQLAKLLVENSPTSEVSFAIYSDALVCPAGSTAAEMHIGALSENKKLVKFLTGLDVLTFENEFIDITTLRDACKNLPQLSILPDLELIQTLQNKLQQKNSFIKLNLPTSTFFAFDPKVDDLSVWLKMTFNKLNCKMVIKWAFGGYDGKGNFVLTSEKDFSEALMFCKKAIANKSTVYAEAFIPFVKELAQVYTRSTNGDFINYPMVVSEQEENVCRLVYGPASQFGISSELENMALATGKTLADSLNYVGTFAVEYFLTKEGSLLINEMSPRVHNTGHYTLDACSANQFTNHVNAILAEPLIIPTTKSFFAMRNILGPAEVNVRSSPLIPKDMIKDADTTLYWYNKVDIRPYRKMGHINTTAGTKDDLLKKMESMKTIEQRIWSLL